MSRKTQGIVFGIVSGVWLLALPLASFMALMSVMMSDAGSNRAVETAILLAFGFPVSIFLCTVVGWVAYGFRRPVTAAILFGAPVAYFVLMMVGISVLLDHGPRSPTPWN